VWHVRAPHVLAKLGLGVGSTSVGRLTKESVHLAEQRLPSRLQR
jgi:hypothetical protein